jgi:hypothetical protein
MPASALVLPAATETSPGVVQVDGTTIIATGGVISSAAPAASLPAGLTWDGTTFTVAGGISATELAITGGPVIPPSPSGLYLLQGSPTVPLVPVAYAPTAVEALTAAIPTIGAWSAETITLAAAGATINSALAWNPQSDPGAATNISMWVSAAGTISIRVLNLSSTPVAAFSITVKVV